MLRNFTQAFSWICSESRKPLFIYTSLPSPCSRAHGHAQSSFIVMVAFKRWKIDRSVNWVGNCIDLFYSSRGMSGKKFAIHVDIITKIYNIVRWSIFRFLEYRKKYFKITLEKKFLSEFLSNNYYWFNNYSNRVTFHSFSTFSTPRKFYKKNIFSNLSRQQTHRQRWKEEKK